MQPRPHVRSLLDEHSEANKAKFGGAATTGGFNTGPRASLGFEAAKKRGVTKKKACLARFFDLIITFSYSSVVACILFW